MLNATGVLGSCAWAPEANSRSNPLHATDIRNILMITPKFQLLATQAAVRLIPSSVSGDEKGVVSPATTPKDPAEDTSAI